MRIIILGDECTTLHDWVICVDDYIIYTIIMLGDECTTLHDWVICVDDYIIYTIIITLCTKKDFL